MSSSSRSTKAVAQQALLRRTSAATANPSSSAAAASSSSRHAATTRRTSTMSLAATARRSRPGATQAFLRALARRQPYTTEQVLKLRGATIDPKKQKILYDPKDEKDNCGVGLIANLKSKPSRYVVEAADEMLVRMSHRGGTGVDPASGDGAGKRIKSYPLKESVRPRQDNIVFEMIVRGRNKT